MEEHDLDRRLGMLSRCCDHSHRLPDDNEFSPGQRLIIEHVCKLCAEGFPLASR